jgi:hypothetical protein
MMKTFVAMLLMMMLLPLGAWAGGTIKVKLVDGQGDPIPDKCNIVERYGHNSGCTNSNGIATLNTGASGEVQIAVNGKCVGYYDVGSTAVIECKFDLGSVYPKDHEVESCFD